MKDSIGKRKRSKYFSDPKTQSRVLVVFLILSVVYAALNIYISQRAYTALSSDMMELEMPSRTRLEADIIVDEHAMALKLQSVIFTVLSMGMLMMAGMLLSHRLGGPITNLRLYLSRVCSGEIEARPVQFRKDDFFHDLASLFNRFQVKFGIISEDRTEGANATPKK